ncbi:hypothetical protein KIF59_16685 [Enterobacter cloacae subsp. cloacae]|nr:hypothetical protein [Enterobacter cloacae subsp. cloacae]
MGVRDAVLARLVWDAKGSTPAVAEQFNLKYWYPAGATADASVRQTLLARSRTASAPASLDDGINALFINYRLDADTSRAV